MKALHICQAQNPSENGLGFWKPWWFFLSFNPDAILLLIHNAFPAPPCQKILEKGILELGVLYHTLSLTKHMISRYLTEKQSLKLGM